MQISPITTSQWQKVLKAFLYSFASGFATGVSISLQSMLGGTIDVSQGMIISLVLAGLVGGFNGVFVAIKQLFTIAPEQIDG